MRKQCPQLVLFKLNTINTLIKSFIHSVGRSVGRSQQLCCKILCLNSEFQEVFFLAVFRHWKQSCNLIMRKLSAKPDRIYGNFLSYKS